MLNAIDAGLVVLLTAGLATRAYFAMRRLRAAGPDEQARLRPALWRRAIVSQWLLVAAVLGLTAWRRLSFDALGLGWHPSWGLAGVLLGTVLMIGAVMRQRGQIESQPELFARVRGRLELAGPLLPHARSEWPGFVPLAITAGVCEEILFRGYLTWVLAHLIPSFGLVVLAQGALFGLAHAYQGPRGVLFTGFVGLFLGAVTWVSGSLWAAILLHALIDLNAGDLAVRVFSRPAPATVS